MLMRFDPFRDLDSVAQMLSGRTTGMRENPVPMDAYRDGDRLIAHFDIPGVQPDSIDITVEQNVLTMRAERHWELREGQELIIQERPQGMFVRQLFLGEGLDPERVEANYDLGVLTLTIPVAEQAKPRRVSVVSGGERRDIETNARELAADTGGGRGTTGATERSAETTTSADTTASEAPAPASA
jgi:HSP20 family protein